VRTTPWQFDNPDIVRKSLPKGVMHSMNHRFDSFACATGDRKSKKEITARLWRFALGQHFVNDIETGAFEVADDIVTASEHLLTTVPDAQTWFIRIGHPAVYHFGARSLRKSL
jgi:hypothetical protein